MREEMAIELSKRINETTLFYRSLLSDQEAQYQAKLDRKIEVLEREALRRLQANDFVVAVAAAQQPSSPVQPQAVVHNEMENMKQKLAIEQLTRQLENAVSSNQQQEKQITEQETIIASLRRSCVMATSSLYLFMLTFSLHLLTALKTAEAEAMAVQHSRDEDLAGYKKVFWRPFLITFSSRHLTQRTQERAKLEAVIEKQLQQLSAASQRESDLEDEKALLIAEMCSMKEERAAEQRELEELRLAKFTMKGVVGPCLTLIFSLCSSRCVCP